MTVEYLNQQFDETAADKAELVPDADGALWRVPCVGGGYVETTDEGLREIRNLIRSKPEDFFIDDAHITV